MASLLPTTGRHPHRERGFTLIELMVVIALIVIIATIAIPNLSASRITANEGSAIESLRVLAGAQTTFKMRNRIDSNVPQDGEGEYGYLAELSGQLPLRGSNTPINPPTLSGKFGIVQNSAVNTAGYLVAMYLPDPAGAGVPEDPNGGLANPGLLDPDLAEQYWVAYAWPIRFEGTGRRVFVVNESGQIMVSDNRGLNQGYEGTTTPIPFDAAFRIANDMTSGLALTGGAVDGGNWAAPK